MSALPNGVYFLKGDCVFITYTHSETGEQKRVYGTVIEDQLPWWHLIYVQMEDRSHPEHVSEMPLTKCGIG